MRSLRGFGFGISSDLPVGHTFYDHIINLLSRFVPAKLASDLSHHSEILGESPGQLWRMQIINLNHTTLEFCRFYPLIRDGADRTEADRSVMKSLGSRASPSNVLP